MNRFGWLALAATLMLAVGCGSVQDLPLEPCATPGDLGCGCDSTGGCNAAADGTRLQCNAQHLCELPSCGAAGAAGAAQAGCLCGGSTACGQGLVCSNGRCEADTGQTLTAPPNPTCYTPCRGGLVAADGTVRKCSHEGLIEGCIDGAICRAGTCVLPVAAKASAGANVVAQGLSADGGSDADAGTDAGTDGGLATPGACQDDSQCPQFQNCIQNQCYSDCSVDADCRDGRSCYQHACRIPCSTSGAACPAGSACSSVDGQNGFCLPVTAVSGSNPSPETGSFDLDTVSLKLGSEKVSAVITITNHSATFQQFTLTKVKHTEYSDQGATLVTDNPLFWLKLGETEAGATQVQTLTVGVDGNGTKQVWITNAANDALPRWDGEIDISNTAMGGKAVALSYTGTLEGKWAGSMYFFANFGDRGLDNWVQNKFDTAALRAVGNALVRRWGAFRDRRISLDEFKAVLTSTQTESWKWPSVQKKCPDEANPDPNVGCYLYNNATGIGIYSDYLPDDPIPTGASEFPISFHLHQTPGGAATDWSGKIVSEDSLQYAGSPAVALKFAADPTGCSSADGSTCIIDLASFGASIYVGGRYLTDATDTTCADEPADTYALTRSPWLIPGFGPAFSAAANAALPDGQRYRYECRDKLLPFSNPDLSATNLSLAGSNPIPDGTARRRSLELIDGAMINSETLFILFRERLPSFLSPDDAQGFSAYGYMLLRKSPSNVTAADFQGSTPADFRAPAKRLLNVSCSPDLLAQVGVSALDATTAKTVGAAVLDGIVPSASTPVALDPASSDPNAERVHYLCSATGYFDGGPHDDGSTSAVKVACPAGSEVRFFTLTGAKATQAAVAALSCQQGGGVCHDGEPCAASCTVGQACPSKGKCSDTLATWLADPNKPNAIRADPVSRCTDPNEVLCASDRNDLRSQKTFYADMPNVTVFQPLDQLIDQGFRYKTQFQNRSGTSLGFVPQVCIPNSDEIPYCYDPRDIEQIRDRVDCATRVYTTYYDTLGETTDGQAVRSKLKSFLVRNYSYFAEYDPNLPTPVIHDGFERLNAELLVMLGDEAYTSSFASRFDLAGQKLADFEGSAFEPNGINLSGGAGYEMYSLYQAVQYYQMTLDRFYRLSDVIWTSIGQLPPGQGFVTPQTATSYFARLIRASSQKARAWSEISKRYQAFNRPDLARLVVQRAYTSAYLESVVLSRMMLRLIDISDASDRAQIIEQTELAQQTYRAALTEMSNVYKDITDNVTYFGFQPDYIPFPALEQGDNNAFEKALARAQAALATAADKEQIALESNRSFDTDSASFQSALAGLRGQYEDQLSDICGTFTVMQGGQPQVYPAIPKYAYLDPKAAALGDPCGLMGNGQLYEAAIGLEQSKLDMQKVKQEQKDLEAQIQDTLDRTSAQCQRIATAKDFQISEQNEITSLQDGINALDVTIDVADRTEHLAEVIGDYVKCTVGVATDCPTAFVASAAYVTVAAVTNGVAITAESIQAGLQHKIADAQTAIISNQIQQECDAANIDATYDIKDLYRQILEIQLDAVKVDYDLKLALSGIEKLHNQAISAMASEEEDESHLIDVAAAQNDPNVRIYRNDSIVAADSTFYTALQEAYKATKVFEYYTSQSYAPLQNLVLVRMVSHGDFTLEAYLANLDQAFEQFQEQYGNPDTRAAIVSVKDDVLKVPRLGDDGVALSDEQRTALFRQKLQDVTLLDEHGYITMPFATSVSELSPLTRNHKILGLEVELVGKGVGDSLGRIYVRQRGTGTVLGVNDDTQYYAFPTRTAVINTFFNGQKDLDPSIYRSDRLRDRPFLNTGWQIVLNRKDESVNKDIRLDGIDDIKLYVYYTDFTQF